MHTGVPLSVTAVVLLAAVLHATWNAIAHAITDRIVGFTLLGLSTAILATVSLPFVGLPPQESWPFLLTSAALQTLYLVLLMQSYRLADFNQAYPVARGTSPWVVALAAAVFVGEDLPPSHLLGVVVVSVGLIGLVFAGGTPDREQIPGLLAAFATGLTIASYSVVDGVGIRHANGSLAYIAWLFAIHGWAIPIYAFATRGRKLTAQLRPVMWIGAAGGLLSVASYGLVLWAQTRGALAAVAALRETSIIMGAIIGAIFFKEGFGRARVAGAAIVATGIVLLNL